MMKVKTMVIGLSAIGLLLALVELALKGVILAFILNKLGVFH